MYAITKIAEERIRKAIEEGLFDNLANAGKPLSFEDETWVPEDLRLAYRVLKNADYLPPELELKKEILNLKTMLQRLDDKKERIKKIRELNFKIARLNTMLKRPLYLEDYEDRLIEKLIE